MTTNDDDLTQDEKDEQMRMDPTLAKLHSRIKHLESLVKQAHQPEFEQGTDYSPDRHICTGCNFRLDYGWLTPDSQVSSSPEDEGAIVWARHHDELLTEP